MNFKDWHKAGKYMKLYEIDSDSKKHGREVLVDTTDGYINLSRYQHGKKHG